MKKVFSALPIQKALFFVGIDDANSLKIGIDDN